MTGPYTHVGIRFELRAAMRVRAIVRTPLSLLGILMGLGVAASVRTVHITGTVANIQRWEIKGYYTAMVVAHTEPRRAGVVSTRPQLMVDKVTGRFEGEIICEVMRNKHGRWVDIHLINMAATFQVYSTMVIRAPYAERIDLGAFDWKPSHYRWKEGALVIDTAVPRDTVIGDLFGDHVRISPINPERGDSVRFEFVWNNSGQPHVASFGDPYLENESYVVCELTFAVRTDTDIYTESWDHRVVLYLRPDTEGRYRLRQVPAQGEHFRDIDFLLDKDLCFDVAERIEP
ncbi:MAG: hypothetical protein JNL05_15470 [Flavobacteriales bacterium]|nr:hypothetical protein [Flavobacteriales bacterium]